MTDTLPANVTVCSDDGEIYRVNGDFGATAEREAALVYVRCDRCGVPTEADASADVAPKSAASLRDAQRRAVDVILDHLDPPSVRLGRTDWAMNVEGIVRALTRAGLLAHQDPEPSMSALSTVTPAAQLNVLASIARAAKERTK